MTQRIEWIDSYRGLMILLIVALHMELPVALFDGVRIPAFFFISGFLFSRKYQEFSPFFAHRFRQIVVPYLFYFFMLLAIAYLFALLKHQSIDGIAAIKAMLYGSFSWDMHYAKSLWFVTALFSTEMLFFLTRYILKADRLIIATMVGYFVLGYLTHYLEFRLPWGFDVALMLVAFYALGFYVKQWNLMQYILINSRYVRYGLGVILLLVSYYFSIGPYTFVLNQISNYPFMILSSLSGVFAMLLLIQHEWLAKNRFLEFLGRNSYLILAFHELCLYSSQKVITVLWHVEQINKHNVGMLVVFIVLMVVQLGFTAVVLKRIFPFLKR